MSFFRRLFGPRWTLTFLNGERPAYALHENSVVRMTGYVMGYYRDGVEPRVPWVLRLTFNRRNEFFDLNPKHFTADGGDLTPDFIAQIRKIDPDFQVGGKEPRFEELPSRRNIPFKNSTTITENNLRSSIEAALSGLHDSSPTFYSVMDTIFPRA